MTDEQGKKLDRISAQLDIVILALNRLTDAIDGLRQEMAKEQSNSSPEQSPRQ